jgi:hypothetical protein
VQKKVQEETATTGTKPEGGMEGGEEKHGEKDKDDRRQLDHKDELRLFNIVFAVPASTSSQRANRYPSLVLPLPSLSSLHAYLHDELDSSGWQLK